MSGSSETCSACGSLKGVGPCTVCAWRRTKRRHGTTSGCALHVQLGERPCDPCFRAKQWYDAKNRKLGDAAARSRVASAAQHRAKTELTRRHREEYLLLYEQAKVEIAREQP